jgi:peroxiredoxin Q/BCP
MTTLKPGDKAPAIRSIDQDGNAVSLSDFKGKKVVLYFYPKDDTPSCTKEACSFRDHYKQLKKKGYVVLGVSMDTGKSHQKFIKKFELPFTLLSDPDRKVIEDYGVWGLKKFMGREYMGIIRTTFVIDEKGRIERIIDKVDTANAAAQILTEA